MTRMSFSGFQKSNLIWGDILNCSMLPDSCCANCRTGLSKNIIIKTHERTCTLSQTCLIPVLIRVNQWVLTTLRLVVSSMVWMTLSLCLKRICSITSARIEPNFWHKRRRTNGEIYIGSIQQWYYYWKSVITVETTSAAGDSLNHLNCILLKAVTLQLPLERKSLHISRANAEEDTGLHMLIIIIIPVEYLVGAADQFEDVDLWMRFSIVCQ